MKKILQVILVFICISFLNACAFNVIHVKQIPAVIEKQDNVSKFFELKEDVTVKIGHGYKRTLKANTKWEYVGKITQGDIYKTKDQVLTVEASHIYEAYIVISSDQLVGFYLPVEKTFSPLGKPALLNMRKI